MTEQAPELSPADPEFYEELPPALDAVENDGSDGEPESRDFTPDELARGEDLGLPDGGVEL